MAVSATDALSLVGLPRLMALGEGAAEIRIGLVDGPVLASHPQLRADSIVALRADAFAEPNGKVDPAVRHGTAMAGIFTARRDARAPAICPGCTLLVRPVYRDTAAHEQPLTTPSEVASAIDDCVAAGASVVNVSSAFEQPSTRGAREVTASLDAAARRGVLVIAAAGNQGRVGGTALTRHPWVIPVIALDHQGAPIASSNLGASIGRRGLGGPGENVPTVLDETPVGGTSAAAAFVSAAIALLRSASPQATPVQVRQAILGARARRTSVVPPPLDAWRAYIALSTQIGGPEWHD